MTDDVKNHLLTKYEASRIIGIRVSQLSMNAPIMVKVPDKFKNNLMYIAIMELINKQLDILVDRPLPHNRFYQVHIKDMYIPDDLHILEQMLNFAD